MVQQKGVTIQNYSTVYNSIKQFKTIMHLLQGPMGNSIYHF